MGIFLTAKLTRERGSALLERGKIKEQVQCASGYRHPHIAKRICHRVPTATPRQVMAREQTTHRNKRELRGHQQQPHQKRLGYLTQSGQPRHRAR